MYQINHPIENKTANKLANKLANKSLLIESQIKFASKPKFVFLKKIFIFAGILKKVLSFVLTFLLLFSIPLKSVHAQIISEENNQPELSNDVKEKAQEDYLEEPESEENSKTSFQLDTVFSVNNFLLSVKQPFTSEPSIVNFNRFRGDITLANSWLKFHLIADNENYVSQNEILYLPQSGNTLPVGLHTDVVSKNQGDQKWANRFYLYRLYSKAEIFNSTLSLGLQRVPFGVGRIWTPTDTFNPLNTVSLEPSEREGVLGANWTAHFGEFTRIMAVTAADENWDAGKSAIHIKSFILNIDMGATYVYSKDFQMVGYELESNFFKTGAEIRSEGGYFFDIKDQVSILTTEPQRDFFKGIIGLDRSFGDKFVAAVEFLYNGGGDTDKKNYPIFPKDPLLFGNLGRDYLGGSLSYLATALLTFSVAATVNVNDGSYFLGPSGAYSLSDNGTLSLGALYFGGDGSTEYGDADPSYFIRLDWFF